MLLFIGNKLNELRKYSDSYEMFFFLTSEHITNWKHTYHLYYVFCSNIQIYHIQKRDKNDRLNLSLNEAPSNQNWCHFLLIDKTNLGILSFLQSEKKMEDWKVLLTSVFLLHSHFRFLIMWQCDVLPKCSWA